MSDYKPPYVDFYKLDRTCIQSYASLALQDLDIEYASPRWHEFVRALLKDQQPGQLRPIVLRSSYDAARMVLTEEQRKAFDIKMRRHLSEAESVAWQCEEGK